MSVNHSAKVRKYSFIWSNSMLQDFRMQFYQTIRVEAKILNIYCKKVPLSLNLTSRVGESSGHLGIIHEKV